MPAANLGVRVASVDFDGARVLEQWPGANKISEETIRELLPSLASGCDRLQEWLESL